MTNIPKNVQEIINTWANTIIIIESKMEDKKTYRKFLEKVYDDLKAGFEYKELRTCPVYFKFFEEDEIKTMQLRHFLTNLMFWEPMITLEVTKLNNDFIVDCTKISSGYIKSYIDNKIVIPYKNRIENKRMNIIIHDVIHNLSRISLDFNMILGLSINIESFINLSKQNERFNEIIRTKIPENMQPSEIESTLNSLMYEQIDILRREDNVLRPMLNAGSGIKDKQLSEFAINGGLKPDLSGKTIPIPINSNFIVGGLSSIKHYYIDSIGGRKALIMNKKEMGRAGYFARKVNLLCSSVQLSKTEEDCGTLRPITVVIKTKKHLEKYIGRYARLLTSREYFMITGKETDLIGESLLVRSPVTCASDKVCKMCYGNLASTNADISIGTYASTKVSEPVGQNILSTKHLLTTDSCAIEFEDKRFSDFFNIYGNTIVLDTEDTNNYSLVIIGENIHKIDEYEDLQYNNYISVFHVKNNVTGEMIEFADKELKELFLAETLVKLVKKKKEIYEIKLSDLDNLTELFIVEIENNELTKPLYNIIGVLCKADHNNCNTIDEMVQSLVDLLIESKIAAVAVHAEVLIRPLIRDVYEVLERPNFRKYVSENDYQIMTVDSALVKNPSVLISLSAQDLKRQLKSPLTFKKKDESFLDPFFKETL